MPHKPTPFIKTVRSRGRVYEYFRTGRIEDGREILNRMPPRTDRSYWQVYAAMVGARNARKKAPIAPTMADLIRHYQRTKDFNDNSENTQRAYFNAMKRIEKSMGHAPINDIERSDITGLMDKMLDNPASANMVLAVLSNLFKLAINRGYVQTNPAASVERLKNADKAYKPWPEPLLEMALDDPEVRLPVALLYYTAQRIGDVCKMRWTDVRNGFVYVCQQKTETELDIRLHRDLLAILDATPRTAMTILSGVNGKPISAAGLRQRLQKWAAAHGEKIVPHGLRKNAVIKLLEAGCTTAETSAISGQSLGMVERYARDRNNRRIGSAAILRWEGSDSEHGKYRKTSA